MGRIRSGLLVIGLVLAAAVVVVAPPASAACSSAVWGPDVASYQHPNGAAINWAKVHAACANLAIVKATQGTTYTNPYWKSDSSGILSNSMVLGSYDFAQPSLPVTGAVAEAKYMVGVIGSTDAKRHMAPILDLEQTDGLSPGQLILWTQQWVDEVHKLTGRAPIVYSYPAFWTGDMANTSAFTGLPLWLADYSGNPPSPPGGWPFWTLWQYTDVGQVAGISGDVDLDQFNGNQTGLDRLGDGTAQTSWPISVPAAPVDVRASTASGQVTVSWLPAFDGGEPITGFTVTASPGGKKFAVGAGAVSTTVTSLDPSTSYSFTVTATNAAGTSAASAPSNSVAAPPVPTMFDSSLSPTRLTYGQTATMKALLYRTDTGAPLTGQPVQVWTSPHAANTFSQVATVVTDSKGYATYSFRPSRSTDIYFLFDQSGYEVMNTLTRTVSVAPAVSASLLHPTIGSTAVQTLTATITPAIGGTAVQLQQLESGSWHTLQTATEPSSGILTVKWTVGLPGRYSERLLVAANGDLAAAVSATLAMTVVPAITASLTPVDTVSGDPATLAGFAQSIPPGTTVDRQRLDNGSWKTVQTAQIAQNGAVRFSWAAPSPAAEYSYRLYVPGVTPPAASTTVVLTVGSSDPGYLLTTKAGNVYSFGTPWHGSTAGWTLPAPIVGVAADVATGGYWLVSSAGDVYPFDAPSDGSMTGKQLPASVVAAAAAGPGYVLATSAGNVYAFGTVWHGSMAGKRLPAPVVGIAADPATGGYWLVTSAGNVYGFDAPWHGSLAGKVLTAPIVGIAADAATGGYWLVSSAGEVYPFGAPSDGSITGKALPAPIVGIAADPVTSGYWLVSAAGDVYPFGAPSDGSMTGKALPARVVGTAAS
jgi:GH25 family lysozyme M1 (1,4-beta-N-acetylmuramidase)